MTGQPKRILFVLPSLRGGGAERVMVTLLRHFDRSRFEPHLALLERKGSLMDEIPEDVPVHNLGAGRVRFAAPALVRLTRKLRPGAMLSTLRELNVAAILARPFLPRGMKLFVREAITASAYLEHDTKHPKFWAGVYRRLYKKADKVVCQSDAMLRDLAMNFGVPGEKLIRIYNPVDFERIRRLAAAGQNTLTSDGPHLVAAGRLTEQKGFDLLLEAMAVVRRLLPRARLTILGDGPLESALKEQRDRLGLTDAVQFAGFQTNPYVYFKHANVFVLSSRYEGLPNVVLEALALGAFVVAFDCPGGVREILEGCPRGKMAPDANVALLADAIVHACRAEAENPRAKEAPTQTVERFSVERVLSEYEHLLSA